MRTLLRHAIAALMLMFVCRLAIQASEQGEPGHLPKSLLLGRLAPEQPLPSKAIDPRPILAAIRRDN